mgnify:CR=1 FL=1
MDSRRLEEIDELIEKLKVTSYNESDVYSDTSFLAMRTGDYYLNNGECIKRESVVMMRLVFLLLRRIKRYYW